MPAWLPIDTAPHDGCLVTVRRVVDGAVVAEGPAYFGRLVRPLPGLGMVTRYWLNPGGESLFGGPTEWLPGEPAS